MMRFKMLSANLRYCCLGAVLLSALACQAFASNEGEQFSGGFASPPSPQRFPGVAPSQPGRAGEPIGGSSGNGGGGNGGRAGAGSGGESPNSDDRDAGVPDADIADADVPDALAEIDAASQ